MEKRIARIISVVFHPLLMPTYMMLLLIRFNFQYPFVLPENYLNLMTLLVFLTSFVFPLLIMFLMLKLKMISSMELETKRERALPLLVATGFFYLTYHFFKQVPYFALFNMFMIGATLVTSVTLLVTYLYKISLHMVGIGGVFGALTGISLSTSQNYLLLIVIAIFIAGLTGFARLKLKTHTEAEIYSGFALGAFVMLGLFLVV